MCILRIIVCVGIAPVLCCVCACSGSSPETPLSDLGVVPDFTLIERSGQEVSLSDLRGRPWVANFIFTNCAGPCPLLSAQMRKLQKTSADLEQVRLVSFSVDPDRDTPEVLREYATSFNADSNRWLFLTGDKDELYKLIRGGFKLAVDGGSEADPLRDSAPAGIITHSTRFVMIDSAARIRRYYDGKEPDVTQQILSDLMGVAGR